MLSSPLWLIASGAFVLAAACYLLYIISGPLENVGHRIGHLLRLPEDVIASTFQAFATSGPEIVMAILAGTAFIAAPAWEGLSEGEKGSSGALNMAFSAMNNLLGIGCVAMVYMLWKKTVGRDEVVESPPSVRIGLMFYVVASGCLALFISDASISVAEAWALAGIGILFVVCQIVVPVWIHSRNSGGGNRAGDAADASDAGDPNDAGDEDEASTTDEYVPPAGVVLWLRDLVSYGFVYMFLVYALIIFIRECLGATFNLATIGFASVGGILIMFTSYVSSFPEFMMAFRYAAGGKKSALLAMLFGSNVIDLAFAGFRAIWRNEAMEVYTTGRYPELLPLYIWALPVVALASLAALWTRTFKYKHSIPLVFLYLVYVISGFILL